MEVPTKWPRKLNSRKEKLKTLGTIIYSSRTNSEERAYSLGWNKNKIYCMLILHQIKLMTSNGFCILLILLEKGLRGAISQTWEGLHEPPVGLKERMDWYDNQRKEILRNHHKKSKWLTKENELPGRIRRTNMLEGI